MPRCQLSTCAATGTVELEVERELSPKLLTDTEGSSFPHAMYLEVSQVFVHAIPTRGNKKACLRA